MTSLPVMILKANLIISCDLEVLERKASLLKRISKIVVDNYRFTIGVCGIVLCDSIFWIIYYVDLGYVNE